MNPAAFRFSRALKGALGCLALLVVASGARSAEGEWVSLFDGRSLAGWKAAESPASFSVKDGAIACDGPRGHLFFVGEGGAAAEFENFEFSAEVLTKRGANSGIFFHTAWQDSGWPTQGFEIQVNNSQPQHGDYLELKKTGSLYGIVNVYRAPVADDVWFKVEIVVRKPRVQVRVNGVLLVDYIEPVRPLPEGAPELEPLARGTFALQAHDPESRTFYRNLRVRRLPGGEDATVARPQWGEEAVHRLALANDNFPMVDLHTHLKGDLTLDRALAIARGKGVTLGIATNGGQGFPIQTDAAALAFIETMKERPVFLALQAEGREWMKMFSKEARARFDYIFTDSMTWTNKAGKRLRLWIPEEADIGPDVQGFMDELVETTVRIIETEPIDIYVNPTFLPDAIAPRAKELWTDARMKKIIAAAVKHGVAIEINARYRLPSERFVRLAKAAGAKFTWGTNNTTAADFGDWSYPLEMQRRAGLTWKNMWVPGYGPSRAQRELAQ
ncbi:MAG TPA: family 16 glycoside hydrolase [Opitutus sp.]|nr:family 16 glycoside hydrolase [Opitutus sp.]